MATPRKDRFLKSETVNRKIQPPPINVEPLYDQYKARQKGGMHMQKLSS